MRPINEIIIHATATRPEWWANKGIAAKVDEVRRWHVRDRGWRDIGYHFLIDRNGAVMGGRPLDQVGAHVQGKNTGTIGIALFGGHGSAETDDFADHFTEAQDKALRKLIADLRKEYPAIRKVSGHNEYAAKACPGFQVSQWYGMTQKPAAQPQPAPVALTPAPAKQSPWAALFAALARIFGGKA